MLSLVYRSPLRRSLLTSAIRYNSSVPAKTRTRFGASHFLFGFTGVIIGAGAAGYTWYYFSGVRKTINRIQNAIVYLDQARDTLATRKPPSQVLWLLRRAVKSYVAFPGSNFVVDQVFDAVGDQVDAHADAANAVIATAYTQISDLIQRGGGKLEILAVLRNLTKELQPKNLGLKEIAEKYEIEKRVNHGMATATATTAATMTKIQESELYGRLQKVKSPFRRKPVDDGVSLDPLQPEPATPLKSDDESLDPPQPAADATPDNDQL